jgi:hypothetical protein
MDHHHHEDETYFLDQICMVALSGAFGVICLCMYFLQQGMLYRLLGEQFHPFVLASGVALVLIALVRAATLWSQAGAVAHENHDLVHGFADEDHTHSHGEHGHGEHSHGEHSHSHDHSDVSHAHSHGEHAHSHGDSGHDHGHSHAELAQSRAFGHIPQSSSAHSHSHADSHADHDHGWAPWRYVVLLVPIILFLLGLPSKGPSIDKDRLGKVDTTRDVIEEATFATTLTALSGHGWSALGALAARQASDALAGDVQPVNVKLLEAMASSAAEREYWKGKTIQVRGQYAPQSDRVFSLVRFRIQCCAGDAVQIDIPVLAKDSITHVKSQGWVEVTGRVDFRQIQGTLKTIVIVANRNHVQPCNPDLNPYVQ